jgi:GMP synthase (glutamine-hydrolysing)
MRPVLFVRNDAGDTLGIAPKVFADDGVDVRVLEAFDPAAEWPDADDVSGVVMFGGSMNVDQLAAHPFLARDRDLARTAVEHAVPYLGICLGAQLLARALDSPVVPAPVREIGFEPLHPLPAAASDPLLSHYEDGDRVFHWHEDTLELPRRAVHLATGDRIAAQAFRVGPVAWGLQFHFEIDGHEMELWLDASGPGVEEAWGKSAETLRREAGAHLDAHQAKGAEILRRFAAIVRGAR